MKDRRPKRPGTIARELSVAATRRYRAAWNGPSNGQAPDDWGTMWQAEEWLARRIGAEIRKARRGEP